MSTKKKNILDKILSAIKVIAVTVALYNTIPTKSYAGHAADGALDNPAHVTFLRDSIRNNYIASLMIMAEQFTTVMMKQVFIIGSFFDAKHQLELQGYFQEQMADAHIQYHPSHQLCTFGTNVRSLAASEQLSRVNARLLSEAMMDREILNENTLSSDGTVSDKNSRLKQFKETYCNTNANSGEMVFFCGLDNDGNGVIDVPGGGPPERVDKDIDFMRTLGGQYTVDVNLTDGTTSPDEEDVLALSQNLFAHEVISTVPESLLVKEQGKDNYLDTRSIHAMRGIARHSFSNLVGMKSKGSPDSTTLVSEFMANIIRDLGVPDQELELFLGENPSYFAQMEVLTRKIYQHPSFFVNLYQKPENVKRTSLAIQALELMNDRDRFEAMLRREMLISMILEANLRWKQEDVNNDLLKTYSSLLPQ